MSVPGRAPSTLDVSATAPVPFTRLTRVELRKSYDTRSSFWLLVSIGLIVLLIEGFLLIVSVVEGTPASFEDFVVLAAFGTAVLLPLLGIMLVTTEWSQRTAMVTFALEPNRARVMLAKMAAGLAITLLTVVVTLAVGVVCTLLLGAAQGSMDWSIGVRALTGFALTQGLAMLGGIALAALLLNTPAAIVVFFLYRFVLPGLLAVLGELVGWLEGVTRLVNFQVAQGPLYDLTLSGVREWRELLVSGFVWLVVPMALGVWRVRRAEVK